MRSPLGSSALVSRYARVIWLRELAGTVGASERALRAAAAVVVGLLMLVSLALAAVLEAFLRSLGEGATIDTSALTSLVLAGVMVTAATYQVILCVSLPQHTAFDDLVALLPVSRASVRAGVLGPVAGTGLILSIATAAATFPLLVRMQQDRPVVTALSVIWVTAWIAGVVPSVFFHTRALLRDRVHLPGNYALGAAALVSAAVVGLLVGPDLVPRQADTSVTGVRRLAPLWGVALLTSGSSATSSDVWQAAATVAAWSVVALVLAWRLLHLRESASDRAWTRALRRVPVPTRSLGARIWLEVLVLARLPQTAVMALFVVASALTARLTAGALGGSNALHALTVVGLVLPWGLASYSYGATRPAHWLLDILVGRSGSWRLPKAIGTLVIGGTLSAVFGTVVLTGPAAPAWHEAQQAIMLGVSLWAVALVCGVAVPFSLRQPVSTTVTTTTTTIVWLATSLGGRWIAAQVGLPADLWATVAVVALGAVTYLVLTSSRTTSRE